MARDIVITGMGAVTPVGIGVEQYWQALLRGECGIGPITAFDASALPVRIAAQVRDFSPDGLPRQLARSDALFMQYAHVAALEALVQSSGQERLADNPQELPKALGADCGRIAVVMGTAMAGVSLTASAEQQRQKCPTGKVSPYFVPSVIGNMAAAHVAMEFGLRGPGLTISTACSSGGDSLMTGAMLLLQGMADVVLVLGGESILCPLVFSSLAQAKALSRRNDEPRAACRPFDAGRDGFVVGEGGGAMVLEREAHARSRGAGVLARLAGWGNTLDAYHMTSPEPNGAGAARCMHAALDCAGLKPQHIGYINAHGTSTLLGDRAESAAIRAVFGADAPAVSSSKAATGHMMGAGGITEVIACVLAMRDGILPATLNYSIPDELCDLDYVPNHARPAQVGACISNSLGFGGQNSCIVVTAPDFAA